MPSSDDVHIIWLISSVHAFKKIFHSQELPRKYLPIHLQFIEPASCAVLYGIYAPIPTLPIPFKEFVRTT